MVTINALEKSKNIGTIFPDLSEAFDTLYHNLLFVKLNTCDFSFNVMKIFQIFLTEQFQSVNIGNSFSEFCKILLGVQHVSILGTFVFNMFINDIF